MAFAPILIRTMFLFGLSTLTNANSYKYTVCTTPKFINECEQINRTNSIQCIILGDEASCTERVNNGGATFTSLSAKGAFLGAANPNLVTLATFQLTTELFRHDYQTAIVTNTRIENGLAGLRNFSYCHPGFDTVDSTPFTLMEFERQVLADNNIDICFNDTETLAEKHIRAISQFFGPSCRPGMWVQNDEFAKKLEQAYPSLRQLCNTTAYQTNSGQAFQQTMDCLLNSNTPAVALTTIATITSEMQKRNFTAFTICRNGSISNVNDALCEWSTIPNRIVVANRENYEDLPYEFNYWFVGSLDPMPLAARIELSTAQINLLKKVLYPEPVDSYNIIVGNYSGLRSLNEYMSTFRQNLTIQTSRLCRTEMRWCTISDNEQRKCQVWSRAGLHYGIQPILSCVQQASRRDCIDTINMNSADVVTIGADFGYFAKKAGLAAIAFPETVESSLIRTVLVVRPSITRLENLKAKRGCFARYGNAAWLSFIDATRNVILAKDTCDYGKLLSDALGSSCMPGASSLNFDNVCSLCSTGVRGEETCASDSTNIYFGNQGALDCLSHVGDFAVITKADNLVLPDNVTVMCRNGSVSRLPGLDVDDACFLSVITTDEIVTRRGDQKNADIQLALLESDRRFAVDPRTPFKLFGTFDGIPDLLFRDSTPGLDLPSSTHTAIKNYRELFSHIDQCTAGTFDRLSPSIVLVLMSVLVLFA